MDHPEPPSRRPRPDPDHHHGVGHDHGHGHGHDHGHAHDHAHATGAGSEAAAAGTGKLAERNTRQRQAIREVIADSVHPLSPKDILDRAQGRVTGIGMATVYRTLKLLAEAGVVRAVEIPGDAPRYELAGKPHHHHFYCRGCSRVFEIEGCCGHFDDAVPPGFALEGHEVLLFGRCDECEGGSAAAPPAIPKASKVGRGRRG